jgi:hypothetical protein
MNRFLVEMAPSIGPMRASNRMRVENRGLAGGYNNQQEVRARTAPAAGLRTTRSRLDPTGWLDRLPR